MRPVATRGLVVTVTRELRPVWDLTADEIFDVWMHFCVRRWLLVAGGPFLLCFPTFSIESRSCVLPLLPPSACRVRARPLQAASGSFTISCLDTHPLFMPSISGY